MNKPSNDVLHVAVLSAECDFPGMSRSSANRIWRGAFIRAVATTQKGLWHAAWSGRDPHTGETEHQPPRVFYRVDEDLQHRRLRPVITIIDRDIDLVESLMQHALTSVSAVQIQRDREPESRIVPIRWTAQQDYVWPWMGSHMAIYETITPYYPCKAASEREPQWRDVEMHAAWASATLHSSLLTRLTGWGLSTANPSRAPFVQVLQHRPCPVTWARPAQDKRFTTGGFMARFATRVQLPDGTGLGHHAAEGWGAVRMVTTYPPIQTEPIAYSRTFTAKRSNP